MKWIECYDSPMLTLQLYINITSLLRECATLFTPPHLSPVTAGLFEVGRGRGRGGAEFSMTLSEEKGPDTGTNSSVLFFLLTTSSEIFELEVVMVGAGADGPPIG